jgi:hypothetical protein
MGAARPDASFRQCLFSLIPAGYFGDQVTDRPHLLQFDELMAKVVEIHAERTIIFRKSVKSRLLIEALRR